MGVVYGREGVKINTDTKRQNWTDNAERTAQKYGRLSRRDGRIGRQRVIREKRGRRKMIGRNIQHNDEGEDGEDAEEKNGRNSRRETNMERDGDRRTHRRRYRNTEQNRQADKMAAHLAGCK
jgi:hypothetical protein